jgi:hypothetical protein
MMKIADRDGEKDDLELYWIWARMGIFIGSGQFFYGHTQVKNMV